jgi:cathepsin B
MKSIFVGLAILAVISCNINLDSPVITEEIIKSVNEANLGWVAGKNSKFENAKIKDIKNLLGTIIISGENLSKLLPTIHHETDLADIPESYDARDAHPSCESIKEVRDQSTCGSCWAFGAAEVMSDRNCIFSNGVDQTRISAEDILTCCGISCGNGCNGGYPYMAFNFWAITGVVSGGLYGDKNTCSPYFFPPCDHHTTGQYKPCGDSQPTPACVKKCQDGYPVDYKSDKRKGTAYRVAKDVKQIQQEIITNGPVEASYTVYSDFPSYKSGVYVKHSTQQLGGHAVKIIGWGNEGGIPYWLIANSWNEDWGLKGFFKIRRGTDECGIEDGIVAGIPKVSLADELTFLEY